jgi:glycosyltransferase involved in cell wall biosynthesis
VTPHAGAAPRVLFACDFHLKYAAWLARGMANAGADMRLLTRDHGHEFGSDRSELERGLEERLGDDVPAWLLPGRVRELATVKDVRTLSRQRRAFAPDVVHIQDGILNDPRLWWVAGARPRRYAITVHDPTVHPGDDDNGRLFQRASDASIRRAGLVFVHAEALKEELAAAIGGDAPVEVVPHGAAAPVVEPLPSEPVLLFFGRLSLYKGLGVLLDAMPAIWDAVPATRLVIAGAGELPDHAALADPRVEVRHEHVPESEVPALFAAATAVMLPYVQASQSGVGSRAKSYGRAMVVSDVGGLPELVADGSGLVIPANDTGALATAAAQLAGDRDRAAAMGRTGADTLERESSWDRVAERTLDAYRRHGLLRG